MFAEKKMKQIPTLETERLVLRAFGLNDAAEVQRLAGDMAIADTTLNIPHPYEDGMAEEWISKHQDTFVKEQGVTLAVTRKSDGSLVGAISLMRSAKSHQAELGFWIGKPYWNHGFCTEEGQAILQYAFTERALLRIHACHITRNPASGRVMAKLGMLHEGVRRKHVRKWDKCEDLELYGILEDDWRNQRTNGCT
jgi:RimJ/RimL family protein N-acetyltransferase